MRPMKLFLISVLHQGVFGEVDCSDASKYKSGGTYANSTPDTLAKVVYEGKKYVQNWWAGPADIPGKTGAWSSVGKCIAGTDNKADDKGPVVDCTDVGKWVAASTYANEGNKVTYKDALYKNQYWTLGDLPGHSAVWTLLGSCKPGTNTGGSGKPAGPLVDCSSFPAWSGRDTYATEGMQVTFNDVLYKNQYWTSGDKPGTPTASVWAQVSGCTPGTAKKGDTGSGLTPELEKELCKCCKGCAKIETTGPVCMDSLAGDQCFFTDCSKYNTYNKEGCDDVKASQRLYWYDGELVEGKYEWPTRFYAPYFDSGLVPGLKLSELLVKHNIKYFVAAFITQSVIRGLSGCKGAWAGSYPIEMGPITWNQVTQSNDYTIAEINEVRKRGGDVTVSFGGANGIELADSTFCQTGDAVENLVTAYSEAIDFLKLGRIDFDVEGNAASSVQREKGWKFRFEAVNRLTQKYPKLKVMWTLPVLPNGLTPDGMLFIEDLMNAGTRWDIFNVMAMDYGDDVICPKNEMGKCQLSAMENLARQFYETAQKTGKIAEYGWTSPADVYPRLGSTPMWGMNDLTNEVYTLEDAHMAMKDFKENKPLGMLSNWSLHRDQPCGGRTYVDTACSSYDGQTKAYQFADVFAPYTQ